MEEERSKQSVGKEEDAPRPWHSLTVEETARLLETSEEGLSDAEAAAALEAACFAGAAHTPWTAAQFLEELSPAAAVPRSWWVAHDDGELIGIAGGMIVDCDVQILDVAVAPARRRAGIARRLLAHVSYDAQMLGCTTASLEVEAGNGPARRLYAALGFTEAGVRRNYYGSGADAVVMTAPLPLVLPVDAASPEPTAAVRRTWPQPAPARRERTTEMPAISEESFPDRPPAPSPEPSRHASDLQISARMPSGPHWSQGPE